MRAALVALAATQVLAWQDPAITESSGLVDLGTSMVTTNDSGDDARLFVVDAQGRTTRTVAYDAAAVDVEALAPAGDGEVWVGDIGDNDRDRDDLAVHRVRLADGATESFPVAYADGRSYDAESLLVLPDGRLAVVTKALVGQVWVAPRRLRPDRTNALRPLARVAGLATDAAYDAESGLVVVRGYGGATVYDPTTWRRAGVVPLPEQPQGEGISIGPGGRVRVSSEGAGTPVWQLDEPLASYAESEPAAPDPEPPAPEAERPGWLVPAGAGSVAVLALGWVIRWRTRGQRRGARPH